MPRKKLSPPDARYQLLAQLAKAPLPAQVTEPDLLVALLSLHSAGLVEADLPAQLPTGQPGVWSGAALVRRLTSSGKRALAERR